MAYFFLPSAFQKRLLRYALSRLELLDTDALDLENLDVAWGKRSTIELREVGLQIKKLALLLHLPRSLELSRAKVALLRITVPADIYNSSIVVEVEGVDVQVRLSSSDTVSEPPTLSSTIPVPEQRDGEVTEQSPLKSSRQSAIYDPGGASAEDDSVDEEDTNANLLPTTADLAQSFLQAEPAAERAELEAAITSQTRDVPWPTQGGSDGDSEDGITGTGTTLSLPGFLTSFLKGINDRLQIKVTGVQLNVATDLNADATDVDGLGSKSDVVTVQLKVDHITVDKVSATNAREQSRDTEVHDDVGATGDQSNERGDRGARRVALRNLRLCLLSDASVFASFVRPSGPPSPSMAQQSISSVSSTARRAEETGSTSRNQQSGNASPSALGTPPLQSQLLSLGRQSSDHVRSGEGLELSIMTSDDGKFADAAEDDEAEGLPFPAIAAADLDHARQSTDRDPAPLEHSRNSHLVASTVEDSPTNLSPASQSRMEHPTSRSMQPAPFAPGLDIPAVASSAMSNSSTLPLDAAGTSAPISMVHSQLETPISATAARPGVQEHEDTQESRFLDTRRYASSTSAEDLSESRIFSHEQAQSMYMSALSRASSSESEQLLLFRPLDEGNPQRARGEATSDEDEEGLLLTSPHDLRDTSSKDSISLNARLELLTQAELPKETANRSGLLDEIEQTTSQLDQGSGDEDKEPNRSTSGPEPLALLSKEILCVDEAAIWLPESGTSDQQAAGHVTCPPRNSSDTADSQALGSRDLDRSAYPDIPGAFYTDFDQRHRLKNPGRASGAFKMGSASDRSSFPHQAPRDKESSAGSSERTHAGLIRVLVANTLVQIDAPLGKLIIALIQTIKERLGRDHQLKQSSVKSSENKSVSRLHIETHTISLELLEGFAGTSLTFGQSALPSPSTHTTCNSYQPSGTDVLLRATLKGLEAAHTTGPLGTEIKLSALKAILGYAKDNIVSFDAGLKMRESTRDIQVPSNKDFSVSIHQTPSFCKVSVVTLPVHFHLDLLRLDETLAWFGGFSSILGLGSSMASLATVTGPGPTTPTPGHRRVVRFEGSRDEIPSALNSSPKSKVDVRISGVTVDLDGKESNLRLETTAMKIVSRQEGIGAQVDKIKLSGPNLRRSASEGGMTLDIGNLRLEYLSLPKEVDLGRLLRLLSPSNNKYDVEDDILIDTLLRQRKQGPVLRITVEKLGGRVEGLTFFSRLSNLSEEIAKLSTVTKYLPEDDRAGILTLGLIRDLKVEANIDSGLGLLTLQSQNLELSHVSLPSLAATSIESIRLYRNFTEELLGEATPPQFRGAEAPQPMIMARIIGDEMEPTLKIKLRRLRFEYRIPVVVAITDLMRAFASDEVLPRARSVGGLSDEPPSDHIVPNRLREASADEKNGMGFKYAKVDIVVHDCVLGLNPLGMPSKGLVVLTHTHLAGGIATNDLLQMNLDVKKSSLLVIDDVARVTSGSTGASLLGGDSAKSDGSLVSDLSVTGFVSVAYISSAKVAMQEYALNAEGKKSIELELNDNLLVLESCADSTQTLVGLCNGLALPQSPSEERKYRTEVVPVQDMLASLSGDAFSPVSPQGASEDLQMISEDDSIYLVQSYEGYESARQATLASGPSQRVAEHGLPEHGMGLDDDSPGLEDSGLIEPPSAEYDQLAGEPLHFEDDHFGTTPKVGAAAHKWDSIRNKYGLANDILGSPLRVRIRNVHVIWNLFDGYDWPKTRDAISQAVHEVTIKARDRQARREQPGSQDEDESVIGDFLFNSIYIGIPANRDPKELANGINRDVDDLISEPESARFSSSSRSPSRSAPISRGKSHRLQLGRSKHHKLAFELKGITMDLIVFPPGSGETQSSIDVRVREFEIFDHVPTSTWRKFATYMHDAGARESDSNMLHLEILNVRPIPELAASEVVLKVTLLPLRLHVDQDALDFLTRFFEFKEDGAAAPTAPSDAPFLQRVEVNAVRVKLDYKPKKLDYASLRSGHTTEFMNLFILDQADMVLRHVIIYGVAGFDRLSRTLNDIWMPDIKRTQLPGVLAGLAPVRSIVNVGGGVRDLVVVPLREYRKDGRIVRSIQKGALAFARTTTSELVKLGAKVAIRTQTALQDAEEFLHRPRPGSGHGWEDAALDDEEKRVISLYADQPIGVLQGLRGAYGSLERDLLTARDAVVAMPGEILESGSAQGAAKAVLQRAPTIIFRPAIGATKAISQTLMGATNALDPDHRRRIDEKYKRH